MLRRAFEVLLCWCRKSERKEQCHGEERECVWAVSHWCWLRSVIWKNQKSSRSHYQYAIHRAYEPKAGQQIGTPFKHPKYI
jgi:hypothetical protein